MLNGDSEGFSYKISMFVLGDCHWPRQGPPAARPITVQPGPGSSCCYNLSLRLRLTTVTRRESYDGTAAGLRPGGRTLDAQHWHGPATRRLSKSQSRMLRRTVSGSDEATCSTSHQNQVNSAMRYAHLPVLTPGPVSRRLEKAKPPHLTLHFGRDWQIAFLVALP